MAKVRKLVKVSPNLRHYERRTTRSIIPEHGVVELDRRKQPLNTPMGRAQLLERMALNYPELRERAKEGGAHEFLREFDQAYPRLVTKNLGIITAMAERDKTTGLLNKDAFDNRIRHYVTNSDRVFSYFVIDMNNLKKINDSISHSLGDNYLRTMGQMGVELAKLYDKSDIKFTMARTGGDEFEILLSMPRRKNQRYEKVVTRFVEHLTRIAKKIWNEKRHRVTKALEVAQINIPEISFAVGHTMSLEKGPVTVNSLARYNQLTNNDKREIDRYILNLRDRADTRMKENKARMKEARR